MARLFADGINSTYWNRYRELRSGAEDECDEETGGEGFKREHQPTVAMSAIKTQAPAIVQRMAPSVFGFIRVRFK